MEYRPRFVQVYNLYGKSTGMKIDVWADVIGKQMQEFSSTRQVYKPATIIIRLTKKLNDPQGSVKIQVPLTDSDWYPQLLKDVREMTNISRKIDIVNYAGEPIKDFSTRKITTSSEFNIVDKQTGKFIRVASAIEPPRKMSSKKTHYITEWWDGIKEDISSIIIDSLKKKNMTSIVSAVASDGDIQSRVNKCIMGSNPFGESWRDFLQTYAEDNVVRQLDPNDVSKQITNIILEKIKNGLKSNQAQIGAYFSQVESKQEKLWDDNVSNESIYSNRHEMFQDIFEDTLHSNNLRKQVCQIVNNGRNVDRKLKSVNKRVQHQRQARPNAPHPLTSYYHEHHYDTFGKMPGHVINEFNKNYNKNKVDAKYPGDPKDAQNMFLLYSGRFRDTSNNNMPELELYSDIDSKMPELIPAKRENIDNKMPRLIPIDSKMPELVPAKSQTIDIKMPQLIPIDDKMPELVETKRKGRLIPIKRNIGQKKVFVDKYLTF